MQNTIFIEYKLKQPKQTFHEPEIWDEPRLIQRLTCVPFDGFCEGCLCYNQALGNDQWNHWGVALQLKQRRNFNINFSNGSQLKKKSGSGSNSIEKGKTNSMSGALSRNLYGIVEEASCITKTVTHKHVFTHSHIRSIKIETSAKGLSQWLAQIF